MDRDVEINDMKGRLELSSRQVTHVFDQYRAAERRVEELERQGSRRGSSDPSGRPCFWDSAAVAGEIEHGRTSVEGSRIADRD